MGAAEIGASVTASLWPTFDDVIVSSSNGFSRSIVGFGPGKINTTDALLRAAQGGQRRALLPVRLLASSSLSAAIANPEVGLAAIAAVWGGVDLPSDATARPFALTLFGSTPFVFRSRVRSFVNGTSVGSLRCNGTVVSADGQWLSTVAPDPSLLCGDASVAAGSSCAYATLVIENPPVITSLADASLVYGATLACPPFCAGAVASGVFPLAQLAAASRNSSLVAFVPAEVDTGGSAALPLDLVSAGAATGHVAAIAASSGLFYSQACSDSGIYTDPSSGACTNASDPAFADCAFGGGALCRPCPAGALCPGGFRAWPQRGHWSAAESSAAVLPCVQPSARDKCLGWNAALAASQCGSGYRQGSFLCSGERAISRAREARACVLPRRPCSQPSFFCCVRPRLLPRRRRDVRRLPRLALPQDQVLGSIHPPGGRRGLRSRRLRYSLRRGQGGGPFRAGCCKGGKTSGEEI